MGEERFRLREPDIDLSLHDFWKFQKRDAHGRWAKMSAAAAPPKRRSIPVLPSSGPKVAMKAASPARAPRLKTALYKETHTHAEARVLDRGEVRQSLSLDHHSRQALFESAGLKTSYKEDELTLVHKWHETTDEHEKKRLEHEMEVRMKGLQTFMSTVKEAEVVSRREKRRDRLAKFDAALAKSKVGRAILKVRDKLVSDGVFDAGDKVREGVAEYGKDWAKHLATSRLTAYFVAASAGLAAHFLGGDVPEQLRAFFENPVAETAAAAAIGIALGLVSKAFRVHGARAAKRAAQAAPVVKQNLRGVL